MIPSSILIQKSIPEIPFDLKKVTQMSAARSLAYTHSPLLYRFISDGLKRVFDLMNTPQFTFVVNDKLFPLSIVEAVLLSPAVHENVENDLSFTKFTVNNSNVTSEDFVLLLEIVHFGQIKISRSRFESLIELSRELKNDRLELLFLSISNCSSDPIEIDCGRGFDVNVEMMASQLFSYSKETLSSFGFDLLNEMLANEFLCVWSEDELLKTVVSLGDHFRSLLKHIRVDFLSQSGLHDFLQIISFHEICESQWNTIVSRLENFRDDSIETRRFVKFPNSNILRKVGTTFPSILKDLKVTTFKLLSRGSRDGFQMKEFHQRCDGRNRTLVLIETKKGNIFGGYTPLAWSSTGGSKKDESMGTFLFTLKNPHGLGPIRFGLKADGSNAIYCESNRLLFGDGHAIAVYDNCDNNTNSYTGTSTSFENNTKFGFAVLFDGAQKFAVEDIEVLEAQN
jgi:hypothetical protein